MDESGEYLGHSLCPFSKVFKRRPLLKAADTTAKAAMISEPPTKLAVSAAWALSLMEIAIFYGE